MKSETIANRYHNITRWMAEQLTDERPTILDAVDSFCRYGFFRPQYESGRGRHTKLIDIRRELENALNKCQIKFVKDNDAPRGGRAGDIWMATGWHVMIAEEPTYAFEYYAENRGRNSVRLSQLPKKMREFVLSVADQEVKG